MLAAPLQAHALAISVHRTRVAEFLQTSEYTKSLPEATHGFNRANSLLWIEAKQVPDGNFDM